MSRIRLHITIITLLSIIFTGGCSTHYVYNTPYTYEGIKLSKGDSFRYQLSSCTYSKEGRGVYKRKGDSLVLNFRGGPMPDQNEGAKDKKKKVGTNKVKVKPLQGTRKKDSSKLRVHLYEKGSEETLPFMTVKVSNKRKGIDTTLIGDLDDGKATLALGKSLDSVRVEVPSDAFKSFNTKVKTWRTIEIYLVRDPTYSFTSHGYKIRHGHQKIYEVVSSERDSVTMRPVKNGEFGSEPRVFEIK